MSTIKLKRSETPATTPASLQYGEVGINIADKKIYIGNSSESPVLIVDGNATTSTEQIQDAAASLFTSGTHTGISVSYPDTNNAINLTNTGVLSFNTRTGAVTLSSGDVTTALGFTPTAYAAPTLGSTALTSGTTITTVAGLASVTSTSFVGALTGNASSVTNGVYTTDTATVTNTMLAGSIANNKLTNSTISGVSLGSNLNALTIGTGLSGSSYNGSSAVTIAIDSTVATLTGSQTLTNKTISGSDNTLSNIGNASLTNSSVTVNGSSISLGGSATVTATATNALTLSTGLTGTSYNGSTAVTAAVDTSVIATRSYVDDVINSLHYHNSAYAATTATLTSLVGVAVTFNSGNQSITWTGGLAIDHNNLTDGTKLTHSTTEASASRLLVKNEGAGGGLGASKNGIYYAYGSRELRRATDGDTAIEWQGGDFILVANGTAYAGTGWVQNQKITTLNTDSLVFSQISGPGTFTADETTLTLTGNVFSIKNTYVGQTSITTLGTIATGTWNASTIGETRGGTGQTTYATGDLLYASATNTLSKLTKPASLTSFLQMTAAGVPSWTSTIPTTNGGTGLTSFTSGGLVFASSASALTTGTVFDIDSTSNANRINIASGASPKTTQEFKVSETVFNSSAAIGVYTDVSDNPPGSLGHAYINLTSFTGTDTSITLSQSSGDGSVVFSGGATPLSLTAVPSLWGQSVGILYCINDESNPYIIFGDDGTNNATSITITDTSSTMVVQASTLKINTTTPAAGKILTCTDSNGTVSWEDNAAADMILFSMGFI